MMGKLPVKIIGAAPTGAGLGGLIPALLYILIIYLTSDPEIIEFVCFVVASCVNLIAIFLVMGLLQNPFFLSMKSSLKHQAQNRVSESGSESTAKDFMDIAKNSWLYITCILIVFTTLAVFPSVTALIQPKVSEDGNWEKLYFVPVCCLIVYNYFDLIGKDIATMIQ